MRLALAAWNDRLAPVFDTAVWWMLVDCAPDGRAVRRMENLMACVTPEDRVQRAVELGVDLLVCGAISRPLEVLLQERGVRVRAFLAGGLDELVTACLDGRLGDRRWAMPGCGRRCGGGGRPGGGRPGGGRGRGRWELPDGEDRPGRGRKGGV
jgi:predicted Fe-Mo cluster-binding NifX family protein